MAERTTTFRWRLPIRFGFRGFLIAISLLTIWLAIWANLARQQRRAVEHFRDLGASVVYDYQIENDDPPPGPKFLPESFRRDYFGEVHKLLFNDDRIRRYGNEELSPVRHLRDLRVISLSRADHMTNETLRLISGHRQLRTLYLGYTNIDNEGLAHLSDLRHLSYLILMGTKVDDDGLVHLGRMSELRYLSLSNTTTTDRGLQTLANAKLPKLENLILQNTSVSDAGVKYLSAFPSLKHLGLQDSHVTEASMEELSKLPLSSITLERNFSDDAKEELRLKTKAKIW